MEDVEFQAQEIDMNPEPPVEQAPEITKETIEQGTENQEARTGEEQQETATKDLGDRGSGHDQVEFSTEQQERFNRLYRQIKGQDRTLEKMREHNAQIQERLDAQDKKQTDAVHDNTVAGLHAQIVQANEEGNYEAVPQLISQLVTLEATKQNPVEQPQQPVQQEGGLSDFDIQTIQDWQGAPASDGNYLRPWAQGNHPLNKHVQSITMSVIDHPNFKEASMDQVLAQVDQIMHAELTTTINNKVTQPNAAVSTSDTSYRPDSSRTGVRALSLEEKRVAEMMLPDLVASDAHARYALQKEN